MLKYELVPIFPRRIYTYSTIWKWCRLRLENIGQNWHTYIKGYDFFTMLLSHDLFDNIFLVSMYIRLYQEWILKQDSCPMTMCNPKMSNTKMSNPKMSKMSNVQWQCPILKFAKCPILKCPKPVFHLFYFDNFGLQVLFHSFSHVHATL